MIVVFAIALLALVVSLGAVRLPAPAPGLLVVAAATLLVSQVFGEIATRRGQGALRDVLAVGEECGEIAVAALLVFTALYLLGRRVAPVAHPT